MKTIFNRSIVASRYALVAIAAFVLFASGCGSSSDPSNPSSPSSPSNCVVGQVPTNPQCVNPPDLLTVTIQNGVFSPSPVMVKVGQSVNWLNADAIAHTATDSGVFDTGSIAPGSAHDVAVLFSAVGTFNYHCTIHPNETATIIVTN